jgi:ribosomal protein S21
MTEFKRKKGESFESFLRRFNRGLKNSRTLTVARAKTTNKPQKTKRQQKQKALFSMELRNKNNYLRKIGKMTEENSRTRRK